MSAGVRDVGRSRSDGQAQAADLAFDLRGARNADVVERPGAWGAMGGQGGPTARTLGYLRGAAC
jgi:hypothetical protein